MSNAGRCIQACVVGDADTGKTSLICTAANDTFDSRPPPVLPPTRLHPEFTPDHTPMLITDTSSRPEDQAAVDCVIMQADVVVVCFDATRHATLESVRTMWYPRIQRLSPDVPVILACCKADLLGGDKDKDPKQAALEERANTLLREVGVV